MKPLFSVLIANYNNGRYIATCLDSILQQTYSPIEIILVDDASTDDSLEIIAPYLAKHSNIKLHQQPQNAGVGATKKSCIDLATGEICGFVDPDDAITIDAISKMVAMQMKNPQASLIYSNLYYCDENLRITGKKQIKQVPIGRHDFMNEDGDISAFTSFKKASYLKTTGINPYLKNAEDQDLYFKLYDVGEAILLNELLYFYRIHSGGLSTLGNVNKSLFWRWKVNFQRAEEKGIDLESYFWETFVRSDQVQPWLRLNNLLRNSWCFKTVKKLFK